MMAMARQLNPRRTGSRGSGGTRLLAAAALVALLGGMLFIVMSAREDDGDRRRLRRPRRHRRDEARSKKPPEATRIVVTGVGAYDPEGDQSENGGDARLATDGNATTAWKSEHYRTTFSKSGVGLVLDAGRPVKASRVVVTTETPGYAAQVQVGEFADRSVHSRLRVQDDRGAHDLCTETETRALPRDLDHVDARATAWLP